MTVKRPEPWVVSDEADGDPAIAGKSQRVASRRVGRIQLRHPRQVVAITFTKNPKYVPMKMESTQGISLRKIRADV